MVFFKRLSRSRSNSQSYVDSYDSRHDSKASYDAGDPTSAHKFHSPTDLDPPDHDQGVPIRQGNTAPQLADPLSKDTGEISMYARRDRPTEISSQDRYHGNQFGSPPSAGSGRGMNGFSGAGAGSGGFGGEPTSATKHEPAPDLLLQAFNQAIRPYSDKIENLEGEIADLKAYIDALERQRTEVHGWIDKRGLRPGEYKRCQNAGHCNRALTRIHRRATEHRSNHGFGITCLLAYARCSNAERPTRPQDHHRQFRPPPPSR